MDCSDNDCPRFRPFTSPNNRMVKIKKAKYSTSLDPRGYIPVYEYVVNGQPVMWDRELGYVHFTGIWKSLGNSKADIVKMVDSNPELKVKKIRGGFLKIQGTWIPYEYAYILCKRTAWNVRKELVSIFGPGFVNDALDPSHPEYGCLLLDPKNVPYQKNSVSQRRASFTTMRQNHNYTSTNNNKTACKRDFMRKSHREKTIENNHNKVKNKKVLSSMSLSRLLNSEAHQKKEDNPQRYHQLDSIDDMSVSDTDDNTEVSPRFTDSPNTTPSPTFRVIPTFPSLGMSNSATTNTTGFYETPQKENKLGQFLPPIFAWPTPATAVDYSGLATPSPPPPPPPSSYAKDIIDTINATILLQRLSQDDGARPFRPMHPDSIPSKVIVGNQEFRICWDN